MRKIILRKRQDGKIEKVAIPLNSSANTMEPELIKCETHERTDKFIVEPDDIV